MVEWFCLICMTRVWGIWSLIPGPFKSDSVARDRPTVQIYYVAACVTWRYVAEMGSATPYTSQYNMASVTKDLVAYLHMQ